MISGARRLLFTRNQTQGNRWIEEMVHIDNLNGHFQMIFEATGSRTISDIAIDDVNLYNDHTCAHADAIEVTTEASTESDGIFQMQSCANRCNETQSVRNTSKSLVTDHVEVCDCHMDCIDIETCCYDYLVLCIGKDK